MNRLDKFSKLLQEIENKCSEDNSLFKYIGTGNPAADILIIGKETSINDYDSKQHKYEIENNYYDWKIMKDFNPDSVPEFKTYQDYSPLYPYKGQLYKIDNKNNKGTSRTWYNYQKLYNAVYDKIDNQKIDFHEGVFITEINSSSSRKTKDADTSSINFRKEVLLNSEFIKDFPIVIISGVGYFNISETENEIVKIFDVEYLKKYNASGKKSQPYWVHKSKDGQRLLINTHQSSIGIADVLIKEISDFIKNNQT